MSYEVAYGNVFCQIESISKMKIALAQINTSMGAIDSNMNKIQDYLEQADRLGADLTVFPELALVGYPPKDHVLAEGFVDQNLFALETLVKNHKNKRFIVGYIEKNTDSFGKGMFNAAAYVNAGQIEQICRKILLPNYDVFDETRYFDSGKEACSLKIIDHHVGLSICEDMWSSEKIERRFLYETNPLNQIAQMEAHRLDLMVNISGSPYVLGKEEVRHELVKRLVQAYKTPFAFVNLVGGNDELLFDGGSFVMNKEGHMTTRASVFKEDLVLAEVPSPAKSQIAWPTDSRDWQARALTMGLKDYVMKCGFNKVVLGLSGGIDSALTLLLAVDALGKNNVFAVLMPSPYTSDASIRDAKQMAKVLGVQTFTIPISHCMSAYDQVLKDAFKGKPPDVTEENLQARIRGNILMALSNKFGMLVLTTGNKSELAVGYCTQYGDMVGALAVISDLYKNEVYALAKYLNQKYRAIPAHVFNRPPSAELRPDQTDQDSLPPYDLLDDILKLYLEKNTSVEEMIRMGFDESTVLKVIGLVKISEFKRRQAAPGLKISPKAFGAGRRMPIAREPI
ncbi:MAG: NAD+ synthase [Bdellovibrionales bacterium]|nr:NAD+ synthase [Bdellovibrionales bacterium]